MIKSFKHKGLEQFFTQGTTKGIQAKHAQKLSLILDLLDGARDLNDMRAFPALNLHALTGNLNGHWSVKVSGNWRVTFTFDNDSGDAEIVDYQDYH